MLLSTYFSSAYFNIFGSSMLVVIGSVENLELMIFYNFYLQF